MLFHNPLRTLSNDSLVRVVPWVFGSWQTWIPGFLLRMPVLDAANTSPLIEARQTADWVPKL